MKPRLFAGEYVHPITALVKLAQYVSMKPRLFAGEYVEKTDKRRQEIAEFQ